MIDITRILSKECTRSGVEASSRKRALEAASDLLAECNPGLSARSLADELMARERLGSTGLGVGWEATSLGGAEAAALVEKITAALAAEG